MDRGESSYRRFLDGDPDALCDLIAAYRTGLTYYLVGIVRSEDVAEELAEETFFRLCYKRPSYRRVAGFKTWLYTVGRNLALDRLRRQKRLAALPVEEAEGLADSAPTPDEALLADERRRQVWTAMERLSPRYRQILWLAYFEEFTTEEMAAILKESRHNVASVLYRAKAALKQELLREGFSYEDQ